jgi:hypothetical protein
VNGGYPGRMRLAVLAGSCAAALLLSAAPAGAIVPPRNCGMMTVKAARFQVKADQIRCSAARPYARRYLATRKRPQGYRCRTYGSETALAFRCSRGVKVFFAIRR